MRPRSSIRAVTLYNVKDSEGEWIPQRYELYSWVMLMPGKHGGHARDAKRHKGSSVDGDYKARILQFCVKPGSSVVNEVRVQHAYMMRQLDLNPAIRVAQCGCNYLYPSHYEDWIDVKSITGPINVTHADIGELGRGDRTHKELLQESLFFYNAYYHPPVGQEEFGSLESIPLPSFDDPSWPLPDMDTTESFRARMRADFFHSMRPNMGSKQTHLQWWMPIHVLVDLFSVASSVHRTTTLFVFKEISEVLLSSLMDAGWNTKLTIGNDIIKCVVDQCSIVFRFHIGRSTLYCNFNYNRERCVAGTWELMDQSGPINSMKILCEFEEFQDEVEVGRNWNISSVRQEICVTLGAIVPKEFDLWIIGDGLPAQKINRRNEKNHIAEEVMPPKRLRIVQ